MGNTIKRFDKLLTTAKSALLIIDIQERILPVIHQHKLVVENTIKLIKGFKVLGLPIFHTEQYPKGLGHTVSAVQDELKNNEAIQKLIDEDKAQARYKKGILSIGLKHCNKCKIFKDCPYTKRLLKRLMEGLKLDEKT